MTNKEFADQIVAAQKRLKDVNIANDARRQIPRYAANSTYAGIQ